MTDQPELLPCPFCGSPPSWLSRSTASGTGASGMEAPMRALGCNMPLCARTVQTPWRDTEGYDPQRHGPERYFAVNHDAEAVAVWNRRVGGGGEPA